jgi:lipase maturation factor 1
VVPFFIWAPRRVRHIACALLILVQVLILLTGNYCFFNLLTIALCLLLIDDAAWLRGKNGALQTGGTRSVLIDISPWQTGIAVTVLLATLPLNVMLIFSAFKPEATWPRPVEALYDSVASFRIVSGYGLFRVMTKTRPEIVLEGSADGIEWRPYEFKWKPGDLKQPPHWVAPHQPRLDWQMWFAALDPHRQKPWFVSLVVNLLNNNPDVTRLLARNSFPKDPPRYIRATLYDYRFTSWDEHKATGAWWKREELGEYLPPVSLR